MLVFWEYGHVSRAEHVSGAERKVLPLRIKPDFSDLCSPLTPVINSVANSGLLSLRVALFYSLLW